VEHAFHRLLKNSDFESVRVVLAFRPAYKSFVYDHEPASAGGRNASIRVFQQPARAVNYYFRRNEICLLIPFRPKAEKPG